MKLILAKIVDSKASESCRTRRYPNVRVLAAGVSHASPEKATTQLKQDSEREESPYKDIEELAAKHGLSPRRLMSYIKDRTKRYL
jgi:hypothetical protein